jgi:ribosomal protein S9
MTRAHVDRHAELQTTNSWHSWDAIANTDIAGCITRDPRKVERKKAGHIKARKMPTWVKR